MTTAMRATSKCNAVDVSHSWKDSKGTNAVVVSGHMDASVRVRPGVIHLRETNAISKAREKRGSEGVCFSQSQQQLRPIRQYSYGDIKIRS